MEELLNFTYHILEPESDGFKLDAGQMVLRAVIIYLFAIMVVRIGNKRFMGRNTAFDLILGIILGSVLSRAVTGQSPLFPTLAAGASLMVMHWLMASIALRWRWLAPLIKGRPRLLIEGGKVKDDALRKSNVGEEDLQEALRRQGSIRSADRVQVAYLERNGDISIIVDKEEPKILEVKVEEGVQTIRLKIEK